METDPGTPALPPTTRMGQVRLAVSDLDGSIAYYAGLLGFRVLEQSGERAVLGSDRPLLVLTEEPDARPRPRGVSGLYHVAYLLPSRSDLARFVHRVASDRTPVQGASDHLVSEAIYFGDPDGHGIEVYADRPKSAWPSAGGRLRMATEPLDVDDLLLHTEGRAWSGLPEGSVVGHLHLNVGDVAAADAFYRTRVGFDRTTTYPGASFLSAGGYHHHVAVNAWEGAGAPPAPPGTLGLRSFSIEVPDREAAAALRERLGIWTDALARDPAGNAFAVVG